MRTITLLGLLATATAVCTAEPSHEYKPPSPNVKDVDVTVSAPSEVQFTPARRRGDTVADFKVKVTIKNKSLGPIPFGLHYLNGPALGFTGGPGQPHRDFAIRWWEWPGPNNRTTFNINPGQTYTTTCHYSFVADPDQPRKGDVFVVGLTIYGHKAKTEITLK
jgi:hypothetical protein